MKVLEGNKRKEHVEEIEDNGKREQWGINLFS